MQYILLIYGAEDVGPQPGTPEFQAHFGAYYEFTEVVKNAGAMDGGNALEGANTATTVRVRDGKSEVKDGPFAETKEVLGGYYLLTCKDLDEAIKYAAQIPDAKYGSIEIRPIMEIPDS